MEQFRRTIKKQIAGKRMTDQFYVDGDVNVPDTKGDVSQIIYSKGQLKIEDMKVVDHYIRVSGKVQYQILYREDGNELHMSSMQGKLSFEEMVYADEDPEGTVFLRDGSVELSVSVIHSRKLNVKAMVEMEIASSGEETNVITLDVEEESGMYKKRMDKTFLELVLSKKDSYRIKEEMKLPNTKETIGSILISDVEPRKLDTRITEDELLVRGELLVFVMYESVGGKEDWTEQIVPYEGRIPCSGVDDTMYHHMQASFCDEVIDVRMDEDGEMRLIGVEVTMELRISVYGETQYECLEDVYSLHKNLVLQEEMVNTSRLVLQSGSKYKLEETLSVPELRDGMLQMCHVSGNLKIEHTETVADGVMAEGVLYIHILYVKANDDSPFEIWQGMVPFTHVIECSGMKTDMEYEITEALEQLSVNVLGNGGMQVHAGIGFTIFLTEVQEFINITEIDEQPFASNEIENMPGIVGYVVKDGDELWTIAKRFHTTMQSIRMVNQMETDVLKAGAKILIFKENMGIL